MPDPDRLAFRVLIPAPPPPIDHAERAAVASAFARQSARAAVALAAVMAGLTWSEAEVRAARVGQR